MAWTREDLIDLIRKNAPTNPAPDFEITDHTALTELGLTSMHVLTLILALQREYELDVDDVLEAGMPATVGDVATLLAGKSPTPR